MPDITYDVGRVSFIMKGAWNLATSYEKLDAVSYNGSLYIAKQDVPGGTAITNTTYWQLAAEKGDKGDTGGVDSVNGQQGDVWFPDSRQLISDGYTTDTAPFLMKGNDTDSDRFELAKKLGNTVSVNDRVRNGNFADTSMWSNLSAWKSATVSDHTLHLVSNANQAAYINIQQTSPVSPIVGHKYLFLIDVKASKSSNLGASFGTTAGGCVFNVNGYSANTWIHIALIGTVSSYTDDTLYIRPKASDDAEEVDIYIKNVALIDLTLWFGSNDRIPSDLLSHPENWGRYYAGSLDYNAGTLDSADGTVLKSIGRNMLNKANFVKGRVDNGVIGYASATTALSETATGISFTTNAGYRGAVSEPIQVSPNTQVWMYLSSTAWVVGICDAYDASGNWIGTCQRNTQTQTLANYTAYFDVPAGTATIRFSIQEQAAGTVEVNDITISLYYPGESGYDQYYPFSVLAEVDTGSEVLHGDGTPEHSDSKLPDGTITRKRITYTITGNETVIAWYDNTSAVYAHHYGGAIQIPNLGIAYGADTYGNASNGYLIAYANNDKTIYASLPARLDILDDSYTTQAAWLAGITGTVLILDVVTPTTEQGTAFEPIVATVKNGVLSWTNTKGIPVGHESHYFENLRKRVEDRLPDPPSGDGTYRLTCTISGGVKTYSWEA